MTPHSVSCPDLAKAMSPHLYPIRLVRSFRTDFRPIPSFLQDILAEAPCISCPEKQGRIIDLLKNIQTQAEFDSGAQGKLWFEIRRILKKDILADAHMFTDGRAVRNYLLKQIAETEDMIPLSPANTSLSTLRLRAVKLEPLVSPNGMLKLTLTRQTSG